MALDKNKVTKEAQKYASKGQFDKAIAEWKKYLKETSDTRDLATVYNTIGDLCLKKNAKAEAADAYRRAADILAQDGLDTKAIAVYKKILNIDPRNIETHLALADLNAQKGLVGNAIESYKVVAEHHQKSNDMKKALGIFQKMADLSPANVGFRVKLAEMYNKEGMKKEAVGAFLAAATAHIGGNAFTEARKMFEKVLALDPENKEVYHKAGIVYFKEGKFAEACKAFKRAFENDPSNDELLELYLEALTNAGRDEDAAEVFRKALEKDPSRIDLREKLFNLYRAKKETDKAFEEAKLLAEEQVKGLLAAAAEQGHKLLPGTVLPGAEETTEAERALRTFLDENPDHAGGWRELGIYCDKIGRKEEAAGAFAKAAEILIDSDRAAASRAIDRALDIWPGLPEATRLKERLKTVEAAPPPVAPPTEPGVPAEDPAIEEAITEADVLLKYGLVSKAMEQLESLTGRFPGSVRLRIRIRDLYREQGAMDKAAAHALKAADIYAESGLEDRVEAVLRETLEFAPENVQVLSRLGMAAPEAAAPALEETEPVFGEASAAEETPAVESDLGEGLPFEEPAVPMEEAPGSALDEEVSPPEELSQVPEMPEETGFEPPSEELPAMAEAPLEAEPARELAAEGTEGEIDVSEVWAEAEFYYQQGLFDEARKKYERILEQNPDDKRTLKRIREISRQKEEAQEFASLAEAVEGLESFVAGGELAAESLATSESDEEAVQKLVRDIQEMKQREEERARAEQEAREQYEQEARERAEREERERIEREEYERREREERERREQEELERFEEELRQRVEREAREKYEREVREQQEREERARAEQEARERMEREIRERIEREVNERYEREARERAEREAKEREERETRLRYEQQVREQVEREARERYEHEAQQRAAQETKEREERLRAERELQEMLEQRTQERKAARAPERSLEESFADLTAWEKPTPRARDEEDFSELGDELRETLPPGALAPTGAAKAKTADDLDDFFDLASELKDELSNIPVSAPAAESAEEQSLDDIFEDFKKGVEEQQATQDTSTHYNLGIAYKEMGLLDDAIAEFLLTNEGEHRFVESRYMLGLCYMEQGEYQKAITEISNALNYAVSFGLSDEERISMLYDLGLAYQGLGSPQDAISSFQQVAEIDAEYRDVADKLRDLQAGEFVSIDQLKEDIEQEITSKFMEEGERIEREEKERKGDKVKNQPA